MSYIVICCSHNSIMSLLLLVERGVINGGPCRLESTTSSRSCCKSLDDWHCYLSHICACTMSVSHRMLFILRVSFVQPWVRFIQRSCTTLYLYYVHRHLQSFVWEADRRTYQTWQNNSRNRWCVLNHCALCCFVVLPRLVNATFGTSSYEACTHARSHARTHAPTHAPTHPCTHARPCMRAYLTAYTAEMSTEILPWQDPPGAAFLEAPLMLRNQALKIDILSTG